MNINPLSNSSDSDDLLRSSRSSTTNLSTISHLDTKVIKKSSLDFGSLERLFPREQDSANTTPFLSSTWYILTTALLLAFHKEKLVADLWQHLSQETVSTEEHLLTVARSLREACLKASTLVGFPRAINALTTLSTAISNSHPAVSARLATDTSLRASPRLTTRAKVTRGTSLFKRIYGPHTSRVLQSMTNCSAGDLTYFAINCIYGELLAENRIISDVETGLLEFVCCLADGCAQQAKGHFFGSVDLGASLAVMGKVIRLCEMVRRGLGLGCPWVDEDVEGDGGEWKFLERVKEI